MPDSIRIKAAPGRRVRRPDTLAALPEEGIDVDPTDPFWFRRLEAGDVIEVKGDAETKTAETPAAETGRAPRKPSPAE